MEINKKNEIDVTENNPIIEKNKVPQPEMKSGLQEKKKLKAEGTKAENVKEVVRGKHKVLPCYDNRELSWLKFNERVLDEASDEDVPLCERLTFVSIFSTNLDEFYRVRVGSIYDQMIISDKKRENKTYMTSSEQLERIFKRTKELLKKKEHIYNDLMKEVKNYGVQIVNFDKLSKEEKDGMENYFKNNVMPLLSPQVIGKKHPFPFLNNQEIYAVALLESKNNDKICIVPCRSSVFNRLVQIVPGSGRYMLIEELILHYMPMIFENYTVKSKSLIRITRNADIDIDEIFADEDISYRESMEEMIRMRTKLCPIRMEYSRVLDEKVIRSLCKELNLKKEQTFHQETPLALSFEPCVLEENAFNYELQRPISDQLYELFKPFGYLNFDMGNKRLGEVYVTRRNGNPVLKLQGRIGSTTLKVTIIDSNIDGAKNLKTAEDKIKCQITKYQMCMACRACESICKHNAIVIKEDKEGNLDYRILDNKCVRCTECVNHYTAGCYMRKVLAIKRN